MNDVGHRSPWRKTAFVAMTIAIVLALIELQAFAFVKISIWNGNGFGFYPRDLFDRIPQKELDRENTAPPSGWPESWTPRAQPSRFPRTCGATFGDSMTHSDEVEDQEAWAFLLTKELRCNVDNFGIGGYGLGQAISRYEEIRPKVDFVILGVFVEMLRRDIAASWTFYQGPVQDHLPRYAITKPLYSLVDGKLVIKPRPSPPVDARAIAEHHKNDFYRRYFWTPYGFPYTWSAMRAIYRSMIARTIDQSSNDYWSRDHLSKAADIGLLQIEQFRKEVKASGARPVILFIPQVEELPAPKSSYNWAVEELKQRHPDQCMVDLYAELSPKVAQKDIKTLRAPRGHYSALGNALIASAVSDRLRHCGLAD